ncbi:unnamed protein product, partial [Mesorhabditis belari]|uniref:Ammonium transporter AmtB-like domain-containing protein n=1 Tax=Mesorhabditis belari TaxID=2138241 RepID=A0AAF3EFN8_9BILA
MPEKGENNAEEDSIPFTKIYSMYQDTHVMIFIGFGFLMTFLRRYGFSALSLNLLLAVISIEWSLIVRGFFSDHFRDHGKFAIKLESLLSADFSAAVVLISMGVMLGKFTPMQYILMTVIEIPVAVVIEWIVISKLKINDAGGSIILHTFGAYFGLACSWAFRKPIQRTHKHEGSIYHSDQLAMIGSIFLWICWPSFNAATSDPQDGRERAVLNTVISLVGSTIATFLVSQAVDHQRKFDMVTIANSTLAGGVAIGTVANVVLTPVFSLLIGFIAGTVSVIGYKFLTPYLTNRFGLHDTCGVHNLHGMPGLIAGISSVLVVVNPEGKYGNSIAELYDGVRTTMNGESGFVYGVQAIHQLIALLIVVCASIVAGLLTGFFLRLRFIRQIRDDEHFSDADFFETPHDFEILTNGKSE